MTIPPPIPPGTPSAERRWVPLLHDPDAPPLWLDAARAMLMLTGILAVPAALARMLDWLLG